MEFAKDVMSPAEAEVLVRQLRSFAIGEVGSAAWKEQRGAMERLNMCTHSNAVRKTDDYVKAFLIEHEHMSDVLHELLVMEVWRQRVLPLVKPAVATNPAAAYMYCSYENILVNLLECICFYEEAVLALGDDVLELLDYCWRQVYRLFSESGLNEPVAALTADEMAHDDARDHLERQLRQSRITRAMACLSILWFIVDRLDQLPLSVTNAVLRKNDLPMGLADVLMLQPWLRHSATVTQKYRNGGEFVEVGGEEAMRVCVPEAHTWFCLHKLLCDVECRKKYQYTKSKKELLLRIRRFLNDTLVDQIPALESVRRALEELSFLEPPSGTEEKFRSALVIEQVPRLMASIDRSDVDWEAEGARMGKLLSDPAERAKDAMRLAQLFDQMFEN